MYCSSYSLSHLSLSDPLNFDREVENKIEAKVVWLHWLVKKKKNEEEEGDKEERIRGERAQAWNEEERLKSAIIMEDRNCIWARVLVTWVGWELGKSGQ